MMIGSNEHDVGKKIRKVISSDDCIKFYDYGNFLTCIISHLYLRCPEFRSKHSPLIPFNLFYYFIIISAPSFQSLLSYLLFKTNTLKLTRCLLNFDVVMDLQNVNVHLLISVDVLGQIHRMWANVWAWRVNHVASNYYYVKFVIIIISITFDDWSVILVIHSLNTWK